MHAVGLKYIKRVCGLCALQGGATPLLSVVFLSRLQFSASTTIEILNYLVRSQREFNPMINTELECENNYQTEHSIFTADLYARLTQFVKKM